MPIGVATRLRQDGPSRGGISDGSCDERGGDNQDRYSSKKINPRHGLSQDDEHCQDRNNAEKLVPLKRVRPAALSQVMVIVTR